MFEFSSFTQDTMLGLLVEECKEYMMPLRPRKTAPLMLSLISLILTLPLVNSIDPLLLLLPLRLPRLSFSTTLHVCESYQQKAL